MAMTTTEMQNIQTRDADVEIQPVTRQVQPVGSESGFLSSLPQLSDLLAQPAVKKATPAIMIGILLLFFVGSYIAMHEPVFRAIHPGMTESDQQMAFLG